MARFIDWSDPARSIRGPDEITIWFDGDGRAPILMHDASRPYVVLARPWAKQPDGAWRVLGRYQTLANARRKVMRLAQSAGIEGR